MKTNIESWKQTKQVVGVNLQRQDDDLWECSGVVLTSQKKTIVLESRWTETGTLEKVAATIPADLPVVIGLDGKGVLHKAVSQADADLAPLERLRKTMPGIKPADFLIQVTQGYEQDFLSLLRRETLDEILPVLNEGKRWIVGLTLGGFAGTFLWNSLLSATEPQIPAGGYTLQLQQGLAYRLLPAQPADEEHTFLIGEDRLTAAEFPAYAVALQWLLTRQLSPAVETESIQMRLQEWMQKVQFTRTALVLLIGIFALLAVNFVLYQYFTSRVSGLQTQASALSVHTEQETTQARQAGKKREFLRQAGWLQSAHHSFYADTIAATVPVDVRLQELLIHPTDMARSRNEKKIVFQTNYIEVKGICQTPEPLREWMYRLEKASWVQQISEPDYRYDVEKGRGTFVFRIELRQ